jgi:hypothetical protein
VKFLNRAGDADGILHRSVVTKVKFRNLPHTQSRFQVMPDETGGTSQRRQVLFSFIFSAENAYVNVRNSKIRRHFNVSDTHKSNAGIFDLPADDVDEFLLEELTDLSRSPTHSLDLTGRRRA